jgi:hypothetical protein
MADGPPFYRLKMTKGTGQGLRASTVTPVDRVNSGGGDRFGGAGASGTMVYDSGDLTWGVTGTPGQKQVVLSGAGDGEFYAGRLVFVGAGNVGFQVVSACGDTRDVPHNCGDGPFTFSFIEGDTCTIIFEAVFVDGTEHTMSVQIYDVDGLLVQMVPASITYVDPVRVAVEAAAGTMGLYSFKSLTLGSVSIGKVADDLLGAQPQLDALTTGWTAKSTGLTVDSVSKSIQHAGSSSFTQRTVAVVSALTSTYNAGIILWKSNLNPESSVWIELMQCGGVVGDLRPGGSAASGAIVWSPSNVTDPYFGKSYNTFAQIAAPAAFSGVTPAGTWYTLAFRVDAGTTHFYMSAVGSAFGNVHNVSGGTAWTPRDGMTFFQNGVGNPINYDGELGMIVPLNGATFAELQAIHLAIS